MPSELTEQQIENINEFYATFLDFFLAPVENKNLFNGFLSSKPRLKKLNEKFFKAFLDSITEDINPQSNLMDSLNVDLNMGFNLSTFFAHPVTKSKVVERLDSIQKDYFKSLCELRDNVNNEPLVRLMKRYPKPFEIIFKKIKYLEKLANNYEFLEKSRYKKLKNNEGESVFVNGNPIPEPEKRKLPSKK